jgi:hypothetical protein
MLGNENLSKNLKCVFFHETGHFVAKELNFRRGKGTGTRAIEIVPDLENWGYYKGWTHPILPSDQQTDKIAPPERLAEDIASLIYGCIFQGYYMHSDFHRCFSPKEGGFDDSDKWLSRLLYYKIDNMEVSEMEKNYFNQLLENNELDTIINLNPGDYLQKAGKYDHFTVDVNALRHNLSDFLDRHITTYEGLLHNYQQLFNQSPMFNVESF